MELMAEQIVTDLVCQFANYNPTSTYQNPQEFRDKAGAVNTSPKAGLHLQLSNFAPNVIVREYANLRGEIFISCQQLSEFLSSSESKAAKKKQGTGRVDTSQAGVKKRRRTETPPDELDTEDEKYFESLELRASKRADEGDVAR
jgi:hypothetical protein